MTTGRREGEKAGLMPYHFKGEKQWIRHQLLQESLLVSGEEVREVCCADVSLYVPWFVTGSPRGCLEHWSCFIAFINY